MALRSRSEVKTAVTVASSVALMGFVVCAVMIYNARDGLQSRYSMNDAVALYETMLDDAPAAALKVIGSCKRCNT